MFDCVIQETGFREAEDGRDDDAALILGEQRCSSSSRLGDAHGSDAGGWNWRAVCSRGRAGRGRSGRSGPRTARRRSRAAKAMSEGLAGALVVPDQALPPGRVHHPLVDGLDTLDLRVPRDEL